MEALGGKSVTVALCPTQILHGRAWKWTEPREADNWFLSRGTATLVSIYQSPTPPLPRHHRHHHHHHVVIMELGHFLIRSYLRHPEVSVMVRSGYFCLLCVAFYHPRQLVTRHSVYMSYPLIQFPIYQYTWVYFPEDQSLHQHRCEIFKSPIIFNNSISFLLRPVEVDFFSICLAIPAYEILYVAVLWHVHSITMTETVLTFTDLPTYWWASTWS